MERWRDGETERRRDGETERRRDGIFELYGKNATNLIECSRYL